jgi:hypothetical protein
MHFGTATSNFKLLKYFFAQMHLLPVQAFCTQGTTELLCIRSSCDLHSSKQTIDIPNIQRG